MALYEWLSTIRIVELRVEASTSRGHPQGGQVKKIISKGWKLTPGIISFHFNKNGVFCAVAPALLFYNSLLWWELWAFGSKKFHLIFIFLISTLFFFIHDAYSICIIHQFRPWAEMCVFAAHFFTDISLKSGNMLFNVTFLCTLFNDIYIYIDVSLAKLSLFYAF